ncbi:MAG: PIN domain nuclease [Thermoprotei archaeon]|nr:MAG: PIN domain nuclease [Thermoprotei archaeon]
MSKAVIDTNVLIYDLFEDSVYHDEASELLDTLSLWVIPSIVIHELVWFLKGLNIDRQLAINALSQYVKHHKTRIVSIKEDDITNALDIIKQEGISLSRYNDKLILAITFRLRIPLASFDERLRREAMKRGITIIPKSI